MAFECPHCHFRNSEIQPAGTIEETGCVYSCRIDSKEDLDRQVIKSESASIRFVEIDLDIPPQTQKGLLNTVEGFLMKTKEDLEQEQEWRKDNAPDVWKAINALSEKIQSILDCKEHVTVVLDDPSGNSYVENLCAPAKDPKLTVKHYQRTAQQNEMLGLQPENPISTTGDGENLMDEVFTFGAHCSSCNQPCDTKMKIVDIPYFKEVVIMSTVCDNCGYKSNEVKTGGAISPKGHRITLKVVDQEDLSRDILKSESCGLKIPEIDFELDPGTLGGRFTTVEGLLQNVYDELETKSPFLRGDSATEEQVEKMKAFLANLKKCIDLTEPFTLIVDDPLGNSYLQNTNAPDPDPNMTVEEYDRTWEQNEFFGLNDIETE